MPAIFRINIKWCRHLFPLLALGSANFAALAHSCCQPSFRAALPRLSRSPCSNPRWIRNRRGARRRIGCRAPPITAGGFVKSGPIVFEDIAAKAGLTVDPSHGHAREAVHHRSHWLRRGPARLRQRWMARHLSRQWIDLSTPCPEKPPRPTPPSFTTTTTAHLPMSRPKPA